MSTFLLLLLIAAGWALLLVSMNHHDGVRSWTRAWTTYRQPPRSHARDTFDPAIRV